ncbi:MAG: inositol monophosphatase [Spirochaetia bacterium]|nr:inositol monophosphatase [Spirochaetia bacterium]
MSFDLSRELAAAKKAALLAGKVQLEYLELSSKRIEIKSDASPVTEVDVKCERLIREILEKEFPEDGFLGEESGESKSKSGRTWIVDPIDGTRPYIRGIPTYSALIALEEKGEAIVGVMHLPGLGECYTASKGGGAYLNDKPIRVSQTKTLGEAMGSGLGFIQRPGSDLAVRQLKLFSESNYFYGFMDAFSYGLIASGRMDYSVNLLDKPWDLAAAACIVREAGGRFSTVDGENNVLKGSSVLTNGLLHEAVLDYFR